MDKKYQELKKKLEVCRPKEEQEAIYYEALAIINIEYEAKFGYKTMGCPCGLGTILDGLEGIEEALKTGEPCLNENEEEQIRAYFRRQGKKLPQEYADAFNDPTPIIY